MSYPYLGDFVNQIFGTEISIPIPTFGSFVVIAILFAIYVSKKEVRRLELTGLIPNIKQKEKGKKEYTDVAVSNLISDLAVVTVLFGILGARLFHVLESVDFYIENPMSILFSQGGFSIYGGLIFGFLAGIYYLNKRDIKLVPMMDALAPALILAYAIGRIGCQLSGDGDWGIQANMLLKPDWLPTWFWAQTYDNNVVKATIAPPGVYPTPLYETIMAFFIFAVLWSIRKNNYLPGIMFSIYLVLAGFERLLIEKIRINSDYSLFGIKFTQAEMISTLLILIGLTWMLFILKSKPIYQRAILTVCILGSLTVSMMF